MQPPGDELLHKHGQTLRFPSNTHKPQHGARLRCSAAQTPSCRQWKEMCFSYCGATKLGSCRKLTSTSWAAHRATFIHRAIQWCLTLSIAAPTCTLADVLADSARSFPRKSCPGWACCELPQQVIFLVHLPESSAYPDRDQMLQKVEQLAEWTMMWFTQRGNSFLTSSISMKVYIPNLFLILFTATLDIIIIYI